MANRNYGFAPTAGFQYGVPNPKPVYGTILSAASGNVDIYTCPSTKRAVCSVMTLQNTSGAGRTIIPQVKISGTYYKLNLGVSPVAGAASTPSFGYILEPGEIYAINTNGTGCNLQYCIIEFEKNSNYKTVKLTSTASGNNTLYTCPAGKMAEILNSQGTPTTNVGQGTGVTGAAQYCNNSGGSRTIVWYAVPNAGSPGTTNQIYPSTVVTNTNVLSPPLPIVLTPGDTLVYSSDAATAGQFAYVNLVEF